MTLFFFLTKVCLLLYILPLLVRKKPRFLVLHVKTVYIIYVNYIETMLDSYIRKLNCDLVSLFLKAK